MILAEDLQTHLLLSHLENDMHCPLCSLSGVSYDELCFHISSAHPEKPHRELGAAHLTSTSGCSAGPNTSVTESEKLQISHPCSDGVSSDRAGEVTPPSVSSAHTDMVQPKQNSTPESGCSSPGETWSPETRQESVRHCYKHDNGVKSEHSKTKATQLSSPRKGDSTFLNLITKFKVCTDMNCPVFVTEKLFSCPMCSLVCSSCFILQEHVELHLQEQHSVAGNVEIGIFAAVYRTYRSATLTCCNQHTANLRDLVRFLSQHEQVPQIPTESAEIRGDRGVYCFLKLRHPHVLYVHDVSVFMAAVCLGSALEASSPAMTSPSASSLSGVPLTQLS